MNKDLINELDEAQKDLQKPETVEILKIAEAAQREKQDTSQKISSGFSDIDDCFDGGFREGDFTLITGVESSGKTTFARMLTKNLAKNEIPSMWFSHEMTIREQWDAFEKMGADPSLIAYVPVELEDDYDWMLRHIKKSMEEHGTKAVFIDTIRDVVRSVRNKQEVQNYALYIEQMCADLRRFAVENGIMVFPIAHAVKNTKNKTDETVNADIAYSAGLKTIPTNILHIWRDPESDNLSYVKIGKSRRDGTKKDWRFRFRFSEGSLLPEGRHTQFEGEDVWRSEEF